MWHYCNIHHIFIQLEVTCDENANEHIINGETECFCKPGYYGDGESCTGIVYF